MRVHVVSQACRLVVWADGDVWGIYGILSFPSFRKAMAMKIVWEGVHACECGVRARGGDGLVGRLVEMGGGFLRVSRPHVGIVNACALTGWGAGPRRRMVRVEALWCARTRVGGGSPLLALGASSAPLAQAQHALGGCHLPQPSCT